MSITYTLRRIKSISSDKQRSIRKPKGRIKQIIKEKKDQWPKVKEHGLRYWISQDYRRRMKNREHNQRKDELYGKYWHVRKKEIFSKLVKRDGYRCKKCKASGVKVKLQVDHILQLRNGGTHDLSNLQLLCNDCHVKKDSSSNDWGYKLFEIAFEQAGIDLKKLKK